MGVTYFQNFPSLPPTGPKLHPDSFIRHDQLGYIGHDRAFSAGINLPVPVGMFMPQMQQPFAGGPQPMQSN